MKNKIKNIFRSSTTMPKLEGKVIVVPSANKTHQLNVETKYTNHTDNIFDLMSSSGFHQVNTYQAIRYYDNIAPIGTAIDIITDELKTIEPKYFSGDKFEEHEVVSLLKHPNADQTFKEFFKKYSTFYKITGNTFLMATGPINKPPLELSVMPPQFVTCTMATDGFPLSYQASMGYSSALSETFVRIEEKGRFRYVNEDQTREIWHVKTFNATCDDCFGKPLLLPIYHELEQYLNASMHNLSLLKKGGRLSGALVSKGPLTDEQYNRAQAQINDSFAGANNAGRIMIGEGDMDWKEMSSNMKDMDFRNLKKDDQTAIYNRLRIPLPLVSPDHMTMSNYEQARLSLYDNAVLPDADVLYEELTVFLAPRYGWDPEKQGVGYDESQIQALQLRRNEQVKLRKEISVNKVDEMRALLGDEILPNGIGDVVLVPSSMVELGAEPEESSEDGDMDESTEEEVEEDEDEEDPKQRFFRIMQSQQDTKGVRRYTDSEINIMATKQGIK